MSHMGSVDERERGKWLSRELKSMLSQESWRLVLIRHNVYLPEPYLVASFAEAGE
jgi:hypothetical protein